MSKHTLSLWCLLVNEMTQLIGNLPMMPHGVMITDQGAYYWQKMINHRLHSKSQGSKRSFPHHILKCIFFYSMPFYSTNRKYVAKILHENSLDVKICSKTVTLKYVARLCPCFMLQEDVQQIFIWFNALQPIPKQTVIKQTVFLWGETNYLGKFICL